MEITSNSNDNKSCHGCEEGKNLYNGVWNVNFLQSLRKSENGDCSKNNISVYNIPPPMSDLVFVNVSK